MQEHISIKAFRKWAPKKLQWLEERGFNRAQEVEEITSTMATLVYRGKNVAFEFSLDVRDQCIDAEVVKVEAGILRRNSDGGYSSDIFRHLVKREGYRGSPKGTHDRLSVGSSLDIAIDGWLSLLQVAGAKLLRDSPASL